jgi:UDP-N-acetylmuramate dehydrogenase
LRTVELARVESLKRLTTLRVGGPAELWEVESAADLREATKEPFHVIGAGSNILANDDGVNERVIRLGRAFNTLNEFDGDKDDLWLGAATPLPGLVRRAQQAGFSGLEGLLGVPAVLGGAIAMNAGTRFGSMADTLQEVELFVAGRLERVPAEELALGYRRSQLPAGSILTRARLRFTRSSPRLVHEAMAVVDAARKGQPKIKSAGCAFKNPDGDSAGRLIDQAGLKGLRVGDAMVSHEHGNFIVNMGSASSADVLALIEAIRERVGRELELEWRAWGF